MCSCGRVCARLFVCEHSRTKCFSSNSRIEFVGLRENNVQAFHYFCSCSGISSNYTRYKCKTNKLQKSAILSISYTSYSVDQERARAEYGAHSARAIRSFVILWLCVQVFNFFFHSQARADDACVRFI